MYICSSYSIEAIRVDSINFVYAHIMNPNSFLINGIELRNSNDGKDRWTSDPPPLNGI